MRRYLVIFALLVSPLWAQLPTVLGVQEALPCTAGATGVACTAGNPYLTGVTRSSDPFQVGVPIADSDSITCGGLACSINGIAPNINLRLQNATTGAQLPSQFKVEANWPSGHAKWVLVNGLASPTAVAGSPDTSDQSNMLCKLNSTAGGVTCGGTGGNFGGSNLAVDNGTSITVNTGTATFVVKKKNFDVLDSAVVGGKPLLLAGSPGVVVVGPVADGATTACASIAACNVAYQSSSDANSNATIEENGPVKAVIKAEGCLMNGTECYLRYRVREFFYLNHGWVNITVALRNADEGNSNTFASAFKQHSSWNIELLPSLGPGPSWAFGTDTATPATGTFVGTESAYLYQAFSNFEEPGVGWKQQPNCNSESCIVSPITRTGSGSTESYAQDGYTIVYNGAALTGYPKAHTFYPQGWGDLTDNSGSGILVGVKYLSAYWPKEINFTSTLITVGLNPVQSDWPGGGGIVYTQTWPDYHMETVLLDFHNGALATPSCLTTAACEANTFLSQQYELISRATGATGLDPVTYYNNATGCADAGCASTLGALIYPLVSQQEQDNFYIKWQNTFSPCAYNTSPPSSSTLPCWPYPGRVWSNSAAVHDISPDVYHAWPWRDSSSLNQHEKNMGYLENRWLERAQTGAYLTAVQFYKYEMETALPHSDVACGTANGVPLAQCGTAPDSTCGAFGQDLAGHDIFHFRCASLSYVNDSTGMGFPDMVVSANNPFSASPGVWHYWFIGTPVQDFEHAHWYGLPDYYFMTGDMFAYDTMMQGGLDIFGETRTATQQGLNASAVSRSIGHFLDGAARTYRWVKDVGDPTNEASAVSTVLDNVLTNKVMTADFCPSTTQGAWPGPCRLTVAPGGLTAGVSRTRGVGGNFSNGAGDNNGGGDTNCPTISGVGSQPCGKPWMDGIMVEGMFEAYTDAGSAAITAMGLSPTLLFDLMDGIGNWADRETFILGPTGTAPDSKLSYDVLLNGQPPMVYPIPWVKNHTYAVGASTCSTGVASQNCPQTGATPPFFWQQVTAITTGISGGTLPVWNNTPGGTTSDGGVTWTNVGQIQGTGSSPVAEYEFDYYLLGLYQGSLSTIQQERYMQNYVQWASQNSMNPDNMDDHDMYESSNVIYVADHPSNQLSSIVLPTTVTPNPCTGVSSCNISWTPPTPPTGQNILSYRLKDDGTGKSFTEWIGYEPSGQINNVPLTAPFFTSQARGCTDPVTGVNSCSGNVTGTVPWFAGAEVTPAPAANANSFTVTGLNPASTYHFALKATFSTAAPPPPPPSRTITTVQR